jgi:hypothetical protein
MVEDDQSSFLEDVAFIRDKYRDMFDELEIVVAKEDSVVFFLTTVNHKKIKASLTAYAYTVLEGEAENELFESFEQLLARVMGPADFAALISKLVTLKLSSSFCVLHIRPNQK